MDKEYYDFISNMMMALINTDEIFTYNYLTAELQISRNMLCFIRHGRDLYIHQYLRVITYIMELIELTLFMNVLLEQLRKVLSGKYDLVIGTIPHDRMQKSEPESWTVVMTWGKKK